MIEFILKNWSDISINMVASILFYPLELIATILIINKILDYREDKKWRPARLNVAKQINLCLRTLLNAATHIVDPNKNTNLNSHNFPEGFTQADANYWEKNIFLQHVDPEIQRLRSLVNYNNTALDSSILPLASDFLIVAEKMSGDLKNITEAYNPRTRVIAGLFHPKETLDSIFEIRDKLIKIFPELKSIKDSGPLEILEKEKIIEIYTQAEKAGKVELIKRI